MAAGYLQVCTFTSVQSVTFDFLASLGNVSAWEPAHEARGEPRPRMQGHGSNPRVPFWGELPIHQEGWLIASTEGSALIARRDAFSHALIGDLTLPSTLPRSGTLTIKLEGWSENASQAVIVEHAEAHLRVDAGTRRGSPYMVDWILCTPYFVGASSGSAYNP
jgi:hypothetical protein